MKKLREQCFSNFRKNAKTKNMDKMVEALSSFYDESYFEDDVSGQTFDDVVSKIHEVDPEADAISVAKVFFESVKN